jgi:hypothetical protein
VLTKPGIARRRRGKGFAYYGPGVLHADETTGRAAAALSYVHVACTEYLTLMHVGGRSSDDIDAGGVLTEFTGVLMRDGYAGYTHLPAVHAWCAAHLLRDLRSISDASPDNQLWALAMAGVLLGANRAATDAREKGADALDAATLAGIRNRYRGALAHGRDENRGHSSELAAKARTLIRRFRRYEDMILRFATDLSVASPTTRLNAPSGRSKCSNAPPAAAGENSYRHCSRVGVVQQAQEHRHVEVFPPWRGRGSCQSVLIEPRQCGGSLAAAQTHVRQRPQVIDVPEPPPLEITEYQRISKICPGCGTVTTPQWDTAHAARWRRPARTCHTSAGSSHS